MFKGQRKLTPDVAVPYHRLSSHDASFLKSRTKTLLAVADSFLWWSSFQCFLTLVTVFVKSLFFLDWLLCSLTLASQSFLFLHFPFSSHLPPPPPPPTCATLWCCEGAGSFTYAVITFSCFTVHPHFSLYYSWSLLLSHPSFIVCPVSSTCTGPTLLYLGLSYILLP